MMFRMLEGGGERLRTARIDRGLSLNQLGALCGIKHTTVDRTERRCAGDRAKGKTITALCKELAIPLSEVAVRSSNQASVHLMAVTDDMREDLRRAIDSESGKISHFSDRHGLSASTISGFLNDGRTKIQPGTYYAIAKALKASGHLSSAKPSKGWELHTCAAEHCYLDSYDPKEDGWVKVQIKGIRKYICPSCKAKEPHEMATCVQCSTSLGKRVFKRYALTRQLATAYCSRRCNRNASKRIQKEREREIKHISEARAKDCATGS